MAKVTELETNKIKIEFEISEEAMQAASLEAYKKNKGKFNIPGFRKGHAPKSVIENYYGPMIFFEDAFEIAFPAAYQAALDAESVEPVSRPENVDLLSMEQGKPIGVSCEVYTKPEVALGKYKGVSVEVKEETATEEDVQKELEKLQERHARFVDVDRPAKEGDKVILDYSGSVDGKKFDGGTAEGQSLDLGSGMFIPGFEEQVVGLSAGEEKAIEVTFPEEYHAKELAGKPAIFEIKIQAVKEKQLPEIDDEFAQDISEFDTLEEYKADLLNKLKEQKANHQKNETEKAVIDEVVKNATVEIPACMIENQISYQMQEMEYSLMYQGISMDQYLEYTGATKESLREQYRATAETKVKTQLVLEAVKNDLAIEADEEAIDQEIEGLAKRQKKDLAEYKAGMNPQEMEYIKDKVIYDKLINALVSEAKVTLK